MGRWRKSIEAEIQAAPDGTFVVRPFGFFTFTYLLPDGDARECYVSRRDRLESTANTLFMIIGFSFLFILIADYYFHTNIFYFVGGYTAVCLNFFLIFFLQLYRHFIITRTLKSAGARRVPRVRWLATNPGNPFASVSSSQLGGLFILFVALSTLLGFILIASYFGPRRDHGGMPYLLVLFTLAVTASLGVAFWLELWMRDRRKGRA